MKESGVGYISVMTKVQRGLHALKYLSLADHDLSIVWLPQSFLEISVKGLKGTFKTRGLMST